MVARFGGALRTDAVLVVGLAVTFVATVGALLLLTEVPYDLSGAILVGPVLIAISVPILAREASRQGDPKLFRFLMLALLIKMVGALVRYYITFHVYSVADAGAYHREGIAIAEQLRAGTYAFDYSALRGTDSIGFFTGVLYVIIGPTGLGGFIVYSWLAFWGLFLSYRAFGFAIPEGRSRTYGRLLFFLPAFVYWPSSIGKDAWMVFAIGIAAYGAARILTGKTGKGVLIAAVGLWLMTFVRPHIAGMIALALAVAYFVAKRDRSQNVLAPIVGSLDLRSWWCWPCCW